MQNVVEIEGTADKFIPSAHLHCKSVLPDNHLQNAFLLRAIYVFRLIVKPWQRSQARCCVISLASL